MLCTDGLQIFEREPSRVQYFDEPVFAVHCRGQAVFTGLHLKVLIRGHYAQIDHCLSLRDEEWYLRRVNTDERALGRTLLMRAQPALGFVATKYEDYARLRHIDVHAYRTK